MKRLCFLALVCIVSLWSANANAQDNVNPADMTQAEEFVSSLPPACSDSTISTGADGTVIIFVACKKEGQSTHSMIEIKNGLVKKIR